MEEYMKSVLEKVIRVEICRYAELPKETCELIEAAFYARQNAQAPYSGYQVGAAVRSAGSNRVYVGCNVERCSYTQTSHAEQTAIDSMVVAEGAGCKIEALAIVSAPKDKPMTIPPARSADKFGVDDLIAPCGHCRQIIWENCLGDREVPVYEIAPNGEIYKVTIGDLFPLAFGPTELGVDIRR